jgi:hypothetical protein
MICTHSDQREDLVFSVYVDDLLITGSRLSDIGNFKHEMMVLLRERSRLAYLLLLHRGEVGEEFHHPLQEHVPVQASGAGWQSARHAGGEAQVVEGTDHAEGQCDTLSEHCQQAALYSQTLGSLIAVGYMSRVHPREDDLGAVKHLLCYDVVVFPSVAVC